MLEMRVLTARWGQWHITNGHDLHPAVITAEVGPGTVAALLVGHTGMAHVKTPCARPRWLSPRSPTGIVRAGKRLAVLRYDRRPNRVLKSFDDEVAHCCHVWNELIGQPRRRVGIRAKSATGAAKKLRGHLIQAYRAVDEPPVALGGYLNFHVQGPPWP